MKTRKCRNRDFSNQFDNLTLLDLFQKREKEEQDYQRKKSAFSFETLTDNFLQRMLEFDPIVPNRYVWHVSDPLLDGIDNLRTFSIASEGLKVRYNRRGCAVFANNKLNSITGFFPFIIDYYGAFNEGFGGLLAPNSSVLLSDFWRIDTHSYNGKWYVDPNMISDCSVCDGGQPINYICTPEDVPSCALKLYNLNLDVYLDNYNQLELSDTHLLPTSLLRPNDKVNEWVRRKRTAA